MRPINRNWIQNGNTFPCLCPMHILEINNNNDALAPCNFDLNRNGEKKTPKNTKAMYDVWLGIINVFPSFSSIEMSCFFIHYHVGHHDSTYFFFFLLPFLPLVTIWFCVMFFVRWLLAWQCYNWCDQCATCAHTIIELLYTTLMLYRIHNIYRSSLFIVMIKWMPLKKDHFFLYIFLLSAFPFCRHIRMASNIIFELKLIKWFSIFGLVWIFDARLSSRVSRFSVTITDI